MSSTPGNWCCLSPPLLLLLLPMSSANLGDDVPPRPRNRYHGLQLMSANNTSQLPPRLHSVSSRDVVGRAGCLDSTNQTGQPDTHACLLARRDRQGGPPQSRPRRSRTTTSHLIPHPRLLYVLCLLDTRLAEQRYSYLFAASLEL